MQHARMKQGNVVTGTYYWMLLEDFLEGTVFRENGKATLIFRHLMDPAEHVNNR